MITCDFYLNNRIKTISEKTTRGCWKTFKNDFGEAISELVKVKVNYPNGNEEHFHPIEFKRRIGDELW